MESAYAHAPKPKLAQNKGRHFMHEEPLEGSLRLETKDQGRLHIRVLFADEKYTLLVEARGLNGDTWLLGMPLNLAGQQHMRVIEYWKGRLATVLQPIGGCVMKFENGEFRCGGFSGAFKGRINTEQYTKMFNEMLHKKLIHPPVRDSKFSQL